METSENLIQRYIVDTVRRLPGNQREDISIEIRALITDMLEEKGYQEENIEQVKEVLSQLGDPKKLAGNYQNEKRYLIGPEYYDE